MAASTSTTTASLAERGDADPTDDEHRPDPSIQDASPGEEISAEDDKVTLTTESGPTTRRHRWRPSRLAAGATAMLVAIAAVAALAPLAGWLGWQTLQAHKVQQHRDVVLQVGRQAAINLTSIDYTTVDADIQRVLDGSVGTFHDEFQTNATAFANVVRQAQTKTHGSVTEAGVESIDGNTAQLLVTASVQTSSAGAPEQQPRIWRMRITVAQTPGGAKVSNVGFVP